MELLQCSEKPHAPTNQSISARLANRPSTAIAMAGVMEVAVQRTRSVGVIEQLGACHETDAGCEFRFT